MASLNYNEFTVHTIVQYILSCHRGTITCHLNLVGIVVITALFERLPVRRPVHSSTLNNNHPTVYNKSWNSLIFCNHWLYPVEFDQTAKLCTLGQIFNSALYPDCWPPPLGDIAALHATILHCIWFTMDMGLIDFGQAKPAFERRVGLQFSLILYHILFVSQSRIDPFST